MRFLAPELNELVSERLRVCYTPHDLHRIELFRRDAWLATAYPPETLDAEQRAAFLEHRRADAAELGRQLRRASRQARPRARLALSTAPGPIQDTTGVTAASARSASTERAAPPTGSWRTSSGSASTSGSGGGWSWARRGARPWL